MSKSEQKMSYAYALDLAQALERELAPFCERTLIAGSIRRRKKEIGDLEIVVMSKTEIVNDMFGMPIDEHSLLEDGLTMLSTEGYTKNGTRYKQFIWEGTNVDLFIATRETWGCVATIRTGSADFTHWLVTARRQGGGCPSHLKFSEGRLMYGSKALDTPEERDLFAALDQRWVEPIDRTDGRWVVKTWS